MERTHGRAQTEVLAHANRLASAGLRQAALELLLEYLDEDPESARVLAAVGRLYLLERNLPKSVLYLQKSLHAGKVAQSKTAAIDAYDEDYDEQDLEFVASQSHESDQYEHDDSSVQTGGVAETAALPSPEVTREQTNHKHTEFELDRDPDQQDEDQSSPDVADDVEVLREIEHKAALLFDEELEARQDSLEEVLAQELGELDDVELLTGETDETGDDELLDDEFYLGVSTDSVPEEASELSWDEIDDLDSYTPAAQEPRELVVGKGKLSREQRARQVAVDVMSRFELDREFLPLLQTIFFENGWGAARIAIERELARGTLCEELALAREIRHFWWQSERYWTTFRSLYSNSLSQQAEATYRIMSWAEALRLTACFPGLPSIEEVEDLIEEIFLLWYESRRLRRSFPVFFKFLKYRTASMPGTLSRWEPRCFDTYEDDGVEDPLFKGDGGEEELRRQLWEYGVDIYNVREYDTRLRAHPEEIGE